MRRGAVAVLAAAVVGLGACGDEPTGPVFQVITEVSYDASLDITLADYTELPSGVFGLGACSDEPTGPVFQVITEVTYDASLDITLADYTELPSGVWIRDLTVGTGTAIEAGSGVTLDYTGWLTDGTQFDTGSLPTFTYLGTGPSDRYIPGFEIGLEGLAEGGTRRIIIPPGLAYGSQGVGVIPGGAIVIFEVTATAVTAP